MSKKTKTKSDAHLTHQVSNATPFESKSNVKFDEKDGIFKIFQIKPISNPPIKVEVVVNLKLIVMEVDMGASTSLINHKTLARIQDQNTKMEPTCSRIRTYTGEIMKPKGCANI